MKNIDPTIIQKSMTYAAYRELLDDLMENKKTTGSNHSEAMLNYTQLNMSRMRRLDKTTRLTEETLTSMATIDKPQIWLTITEGWCGDAAQIIPVIEKMAATNPNITTCYVLRDENLELMDAFLTDGARSIPKLLVLDSTNLEVLSTFGPRPAEVQAMVMDVKKELENMVDKEKRKERNDAVKYDVQKWYAKDKTKKIQVELVEAVI